MSSADRHERAAELFVVASDLPEPERRAYLAQACGADRELLEEVLELLAHDVDPFGAIPAQGTPTPGETPSSALVKRLAEQRPRTPRYRFVGEIARGGMGAILKVWDKALGRQLAMKVVLGHADVTPSGETPPIEERTLARFLDEAKITGQLDHPGIVPVHELGVDDQGRVFFTMRLVKGETLQSAFDGLRAGEQRWSRARALSALLKVCEAMAFAHEHGVVHRDLKPANVMVGRFGEVYVMDWGLGRVLGKEDARDIRLVVPSGPVSKVLDIRDASSQLVTRDGDVVGTPSYMSPEQARGELDAIGKRSDVYSVGAMLYDLLAGQPPYVEQPGARVEPFVVYQMLLHGPPPRLERSTAGVPAELVAICEKAMARDPAGRYPDMQAMADDLRAFLEDRVVRAYRTGALVELRKWIVRNKSTAGVAALLGVVSIVGALTIATIETQKARLARAAESQALESLSSALIARADELGPIHPDSLGAHESWLREARLAVAGLAEAQKRLGELARQGVAVPSIEKASLSTGANLLELRREYLQTIEEAQRVLAEPELSLPELEDVQRQVEILTKEADRLDQRAEEVRDLDAIRSAQAHLVFPSSEQLVFDRLRRHVAALRELEAFIIPRVIRRMEAARRLPTVSIEEPAGAWRECLAEIGDPSGPYGFAMEPQLGLVPLRRNPQGLWEFWHILSGEAPILERDRILLRDETAIVLVLVPAGEHLVGPPKDRRSALFEAYFLSKWELTQGQWMRMAGDNPSLNFVGKRLLGEPRISQIHPVEQISWNDAAETLTTFGLQLPSLAQWQTAVGTPGAGDLVGNLRGWQVRKVDPLDGFVVQAPVDAFEANALGFYGLYGNVSEWVRDDAPFLEETRVPSPTIYKMFCGPNFLSLPADASPLEAYGRIPSAVDEFLGVRPGRAVVGRIEGKAKKENER